MDIQSLTKETRPTYERSDKIIVGFSRAKSKSAIASKAIRIFEGTSYSHVYIRYWNGFCRREFIFEASGSARSSHFVGIEEFTKHNTIIEEYEIDITKDTKRATVAFCIDHAQRKYGFLQIIGMALVRSIYKISGKKYENPFADGRKTMVCSELVYEIAKENLPGNPPEGDPEFDGPKWINSWVKKVGIRIDSSGDET